MNSDGEKIMLEELEQDDRKRTRRDRALTIAILVIGVILALVVGYEITDIDVGYKSIKCEQGNVVLVLEKANGDVERVACPAEVQVSPKG